MSGDQSDHDDYAAEQEQAMTDAEKNEIIARLVGWTRHTMGDSTFWVAPAYYPEGTDEQAPDYTLPENLNRLLVDAARAGYEVRPRPIFKTLGGIVWRCIVIREGRLLDSSGKADSPHAAVVAALLEIAKEKE